MSEQRTHDLPPRWDGLAIVWSGWEYERNSGVFICPPPPPSETACEGCGEPSVVHGFSTRLINNGEVAESAITTADQIREREASRARLPFPVRGRLKRLAWKRLTAWRCQTCNLDTVWDMDADELWVLDDSDYGDEGSSAA